MNIAARLLLARLYSDMADGGALPPISRGPRGKPMGYYTHIPKRLRKGKTAEEIVAMRYRPESEQVGDS